MALTLVTERNIAFEVLGDNTTTVLDIDLSQAPFQVGQDIKRVTALTVAGVGGLTAERVFTGTTVTLTFNAPFTGIANVRMTVLL